MHMRDILSLLESSDEAEQTYFGGWKPSDGVDDYVYRQFMEGGCGYLAAAIAEQTDWPIMMETNASDGSHVWVVNDEGRAVDIQGIHPSSYATFPDCPRGKQQHVEEISLSSELSVCWNEKLLDLARAIVRMFPQRFGIPSMDRPISESDAPIASVEMRALIDLVEGAHVSDFSQVANPVMDGHIFELDAVFNEHAMDAQVILEVPQLIAPTEFGLDEPMTNRSVRTAFLVGQPEVLFRNDDYRLLLVGNRGAGQIGLLHNGDDWLAYYVKYELEDTFLGRSVTQVTLWRDDTSRYVKGITERMFYDVLLARFGTIMSDGQQTENGQSFWRRRLVDAADMGYQVGLANMADHTIEWRSPDTDVQTWVRNTKGWGHGPEFANRRFVISKERLPVS